VGVCFVGKGGGGGGGGLSWSRACRRRDGGEKTSVREYYNIYIYIYIYIYILNVLIAHTYPT